MSGLDLSRLRSWTVVPSPRFVGGNQVELLQGGDELFPRMRAAIDAAQRDDIAYGKRTLPHRRDGQRFVRARRPGYACTCRKAEEMLHGPPPMLRAVPPV